MAKFLNKNEQVLDIQLTNYGRHLISVGKFKPVYYAFYDDNIIYDGQYTGATEKQNDVISRIKNDSQYIGSLSTFEDQENTLRTSNAGTTGTENYFNTDVNNITDEPKAENYIYTAMIGDAFLDGETQNAPAWKIVALEGEISSSTPIDTKNDIRIPQVNIEINYVKEVQDYDPDILLKEENFRETLASTDTFKDGRVIKLIKQDLMVYGDEVNTELLTENFDIEVFEILKDAKRAVCPTCEKGDVLKRKYFTSTNTAIAGGEMNVVVGLDGNMMAIEANAEPNNKDTSITQDSVAYYFDILTDGSVDKKTACKLSSDFNKNSYYIDLDFDCERIKEEEILELDIYGKVTEPDICQ
tara:strand:+ start:22140 stop:23207 length:1068 start_codon:yes stop_codon:yes gene_type:complete